MSFNRKSNQQRDFFDLTNNFPIPSGNRDTRKVSLPVCWDNLLSYVLW